MVRPAARRARTRPLDAARAPTASAVEQRKGVARPLLPRRMGQDPMRGSSPKGAGQARRARSWGNHAAPAGGHDLREGEPRRRRGGTPQGCPVPGAPGFLLVYSCCPFSETTPKTPPRPRKRGQRAGETAFIPLDVVRAGHPSRSRPPVTGLDGLPRQRARRGFPWCSSGWRVKGRNPGWCGPQPGTGEDTGRDGEGRSPGP